MLIILGNTTDTGEALLSNNSLFSLKKSEAKVSFPLFLGSLKTCIESFASQPFQKPLCVKDYLSTNANNYTDDLTLRPYSAVDTPLTAKNSE